MVAVVSLEVSVESVVEVAVEESVEVAVEESVEVAVAVVSLEVSVDRVVQNGTLIVRVVQKPAERRKTVEKQ